MSRPSTIAIDGPVAVGKSSVGKLLAQRLGYRFIDTGAMYRALTWKALKLGIDLEDEQGLAQLAAETRIDLAHNGEVFVDGQKVTEAIRSRQVEGGVSLVSKVAGVRQALVRRQREMARGGNVVMAGRDIGTVVLPQADLKVYLEASARERARRRYRELVERDEVADYQAILADLERRDGIDSQRAHSPLQPAPDARIIDTERLGLAEVVAAITELMEAG